MENEILKESDQMLIGIMRDVYGFILESEAEST